MRRFLAGKVSVVEDGRMDGYYEEGEKYRNKRNYVPLVLPSPFPALYSTPSRPLSHRASPRKIEVIQFFVLSTPLFCAN
jgi:hypothetical protein